MGQRVPRAAEEAEIECFPGRPSLSYRERDTFPWDTAKRFIASTARNQSISLLEGISCNTTGASRHQPHHACAPAARAACQPFEGNRCLCDVWGETNDASGGFRPAASVPAAGIWPT